jgi:hypothetical protein
MAFSIGVAALATVHTIAITSREASSLHHMTLDLQPVPMGKSCRRSSPQEQRAASSDTYLHRTQGSHAEDGHQKEEEQEKGRHRAPCCFPCPLPFPFESAMAASGGVARP